MDNRTHLYTYFRLGLVTGLVEIQEMIAWADRQILETPKPDYGIIELSLSGRLPHSQLIWLLNQLQPGKPVYEIALQLLFARAGAVLENDRSRAVEIIQGLRLLLAEEFLPRAVKEQVRDLAQELECYEREMITYAELLSGLENYLAAYWALQPNFPGNDDVQL